MSGGDDRLTARILPLTYDECRALFRHAAARAGLVVDSFPIGAQGPEGQHLSIDTAVLGPGGAARLLVVLSGVHGVEGFIGSALQRELIERIEPADLPDDVAVLLIHTVNPWGMAWCRRKNESNVDLNRNWQRSDTEPDHNLAYDEVHHLACPDTPALPDVEQLLAVAAELVAERGLPWVRDAITAGQYRYPDGLHYGGEHTEESTAIVEAIARDRIADRGQVLVLDLHTGHGPRGEITLLSDAPPGHPQDDFFHSRVEGVTVEATAGNPDATTGLKSGQIANGIRAMLPEGRCWSTSAEFGTATDLEQLAATYRSHWVHLHGDRFDPAHAVAIWEYRCCFTPEDRAWERQALAAGRALLEQAVAAVAHWNHQAPRGD
jgi:octopine/nopaline transport system ATP-binding protein